MGKKTVFIKRYPSKGELPKESGFYLTNVGLRHYIAHVISRWVDCEPQWWMLEIELPSEEEITLEADNIVDSQVAYGFYNGANFILNKLKGETK